MGLVALLPVLLLVPAFGLLFAPATWMLFPGPQLWGANPDGSVPWDPAWIASWFTDRVGTYAFIFLIFYVPQALVIYGFSSPSAQPLPAAASSRW